MSGEWMQVSEMEGLARRALCKAGASAENAAPLAQAIAAAEAEGVASHGLAYLPTYCAHLQCGKVDGKAVPVVERTRAGAVCVDAKFGFAHPAVAAGSEMLFVAAKECGTAGLAIRNSYNCGVLGFHTGNIAARNFLALGFTNAPASIAPSGGKRAVLGTNPFSLAVPDGDGGAAILIDQSASVVAKSEVMKRAREGLELPSGWALDCDGNPTTDAAAALRGGTMAPSGGYKGAGIALLTEVLAAAMTGANLGVQASPFSGTEGGPPGTGQFFLALDPDAFGGGLRGKVGELLGAFAEEGARVPGAGRAAMRERSAKEGVEVAAGVLAKARELAGETGGTREAGGTRGTGEGGKGGKGGDGGRGGV